MINVTVRIEHLDALRVNFRKSPTLTVKYLRQATSDAIFEVQKQAVDANAQFKTPRALRTGNLLQSFALGTRFSADGLRGMIGPTARNKGYYYPAAVYFGYRGRPNKFMDRIAGAAEPAVNKHFNKAVETIVTTLAKT